MINWDEFGQLWNECTSLKTFFLFATYGSIHEINRLLIAAPPPPLINVASDFGLSDAEAGQRNYRMQNNPQIKPLKMGNTVEGLKFQLAINTAQTGRTFQDRYVLCVLLTWVEEDLVDVASCEFYYLLRYSFCMEMNLVKYPWLILSILFYVYTCCSHHLITWQE